MRECNKNGGAYHHPGLLLRLLRRGHLYVPIFIDNVVKATVEDALGRLHDVLMLLQRRTRLRDARALGMCG